MKKVLFFLATAALALVACNKVETLEVNRGDAINFRTFTSPLTRAASTNDVVEGEIAAFNVTAFNAGATSNPYINDVTYSVDGTDTYYVDPTDATRSSEYYWPANNLDFFAYSWFDGTEYVSTTLDSQLSDVAYNAYTYTPTTGDDPVHADMVYATIQNIGKKTSYSTGTYGSLGIPLNFRHTASKIVVQVINSSATLKFKVDAWKVGYLAGTGDFLLAETSTVTHNHDDDVASATLLASSDWSVGSPAVAIDKDAALLTNWYASTFVDEYDDPADDDDDVEDVVPVGVSVSTAIPLPGEMILVPQELTPAGKYAHTAASAVNDDLDGAFIAVRFIIMNNDAESTVIYGISDGAATPTFSTAWAIWPIGESVYSWQPGKKYTYTIDLAGGGYYETNQDTNEDLDPILEDSIIRFVDVTVDEWQSVAAIDIEGPAAP